jgi:signal peptidase I
VNGQSISLPEPCGHGETKNDSVSAAIHFDAVKVPQDSLFVIGDNLNNSFDSRFPEFGFVNLDQVRGKPLYLYWSLEKSRIGCPVR